MDTLLIFKPSIVCCALFLLLFTTTTSLGSEVVKAEVQYKRPIVLYCANKQGDSDQDEVNTVKNEDDESKKDDDKEDDKEKWKNVQFSVKKPKNSSEEAQFELIKPDGSHYEFDDDKNSLTILKPKREEIESSYSCNASSPQKTIFFEFLILPYLYFPEEKSYLRQVGENQTLSCKALFGFEHGQKLKWQWKHESAVDNDDEWESVNNTETFVIEVDDVTHESHLILKNLTHETKGNYKCIVTNDHGSHARVIKLRIRDKWAFLWPLIGVVVVIVSTIICIAICENIRKRKELKERNE